MSQKYTGGFITKSPVAPTTTAASGIWTLDQQQQAQKAGTWPSPPIFIEDIFSTYLYTGNGGTQTITNGIDVSGKGGLVWAKCRSDSIRHSLYDTARGANYQLSTNNTEPSSNAFIGTTAISFTSTGFTTGSFPNTNTNAQTYVSWTFAKQSKFFDIVTYSGNGSAGGQTINHNLGSAPGCIIVKQTNIDVAWRVYHQTQGISKYAVLNSQAAFATDANNPWKTPTSSTFGVGDGTYWTSLNEAGGTYIAYLFAHDAGGFPVSGGGSTNGITCGSYTGTGGATVNNVTLGYEPQWVMIKNTSLSTEPWVMLDNMRGVTGGSDPRLVANSDASEAFGTILSFNSTGFTPLTADDKINGSGLPYIYIAIRRGPMKTPTVGTSVFSPNTTSDDGNAITTGFPVDMFIEGLRAGNAINQALMDRLRGNGSVLTTSSTNAQSSVGEGGFASNTTIKPGLFGGGSPAIVWNFRRAPNFCDVVCYTGNGSTQTVTHNLGVAPELMIMKKRSVGGTSNWAVYATPLANVDGYLFLNDTAAVATSSVLWNSTAPTSTVFSLGASTNINQNGETAIAYLFATLAGVSKVGSYTGTGALLTVNCGFTSGARFVLIKRTDSTGDWWTYDSARGITSGNDPYLFMNSTAAEVTGTNYVDTDTTGFKVTAAAPAGLNANGGTYIFLAIA